MYAKSKTSDIDLMLLPIILPVLFLFNRNNQYYFVITNSKKYTFVKLECIQFSISLLPARKATIDNHVQSCGVTRQR